jgi:predicted transposase YbfD/YdcC
MDHRQYSTLLAAVCQVPDPRRKKGQRFGWPFLLSLILAAVASDQHSAHAIAHWVHLHAAELHTYLQPPRPEMPSESTLKRVLRQIDVQALERQLSRFTQAQVAPTARRRGVAVDGKELRGVRAHGRRLNLVSLVEHGRGRVLAQRAVAPGRGEVSAARPLLRHNLRGVVVTADALYTQRKLAQQIRARQGHYLMMVKANQPELYQAIALLFDQPPWTRQEQAQEYQQVTTRSRGHGRREQRRLECSTALNQYLDWPGLGQVLRRQCVRVIRKTGEVQRQTRYAVTSLKPAQAGAAELEVLWRGHWTIENRVHWERDATMGEDACQLRKGHAPQVLAALRNALLSLWRTQGWQNIADALRDHAASVPRALQLIGVGTTLL